MTDPQQVPSEFQGGLMTMTVSMQRLVEEATIDLEQALDGLKRAAAEAGVGETRRRIVRAQLDTQSALDYAQEALDGS